MFDSLQPHRLYHAWFPYPLPTPGACSNSRPLSWWCHLTISSSVIPFSSFIASMWSSSPTPEHISGEKHDLKEYMYPIAALFTIVKTWKQLKCPSTEECIKKMWYIYTMEYYSAIKKNEIMPFVALWIDLEMIIPSEVRQRKTDIIWYCLYVESKKMIHNKYRKTEK